MVRHVFLWNAVDGEKAIELLEQLPGRIDYIRSWTLGPHVGDELGEVGREYGLICDFDSMDAVRSYMSDPFHEGVTAELLPLLSDVVVIDLELG
jgi:hypothetical protein